MNELDDWFDRQARRQRRRVYLEDALLSNRFAAYARYRLRFFAARYAGASAVHGVRVLLLFQIFSQRQFGAIVLAHAVASVINSAWWGILEEMRAAVRRLYRTHHPDAIPKEISRWLAMSLRLSAVAAVAALLLGLVALLRGFGPAELYLLAIVARVGADFVLRCYHSGIYAIRRVYRPLPTMLAVDAVGLLGVVALWPVIGRWSFGVGALLATAIGSALVVVYTRRTYRFFGFDPWVHLGRDRRRRPSLVHRRMLLAAAAGAAVGTDGFVVLALLLPVGLDADRSLIVLLFAMTPTMRAAVDWAQLFYFDLKRLEAGAFGSLRRVFYGRITELAWVLGAGLGLIAGLAAVLTGTTSLPVAAALVAFFVTRSILAAAQVAAFTDGNYLRLALSGGASVLGFMGVAWMTEAPLIALLGMASADLAALWVLLSAPAAVSTSRPEVLGIADWLQRLAAASGTCVVGAVDVRPSRSSVKTPSSLRWHTYRVAEQLVRRLRGGGHVAVLDGGRVVWFQAVTAGSNTQPGEIMVATGGLAVPVRLVGPEPDGVAALRGAVASGVLEPAVPKATVVASPGGTDEEGLATLLSSFGRLVPAGAAFRPGMDQPPPALQACSSDDRRAVLHGALAFLADFRPRRAGSYEITAVADAGSLQSIFLTPLQVARTDRQRWRAEVVTANIALAVAAVPGQHQTEEVLTVAVS